MGGPSRSLRRAEPGCCPPRVVASLSGALTAANSGLMAHLVFTLFMAN